MPSLINRMSWGDPPWSVEFRPSSRPVPREVDFAVVGAGFTGLSAATWLRRLNPKKSVMVLETESVAAGASGRTGGIALAETAAGNLPGLGDVLGGFGEIVRDLEIDCDLVLSGAWEIGRTEGLPDSPILWSDAGRLRVVREVPGGTVDPGKLASGLAHAADRSGAVICQNCRVEKIVFSEPLSLELSGSQILAHHVLLATNAHSLEMSELAGRAQPKFTLAIATAPLEPEQIEALGLSLGKPFYTIDLPYLWGRCLPSKRVLFGAGLVHPNDWRELAELDIATGEPAELIAKIERRVRGLHPVLHSVEFTHRWGGPILIGQQWRPVFARHPQNRRVLVSAAYSGHGVALSAYLGRWAAEAMLGRRELPAWQAV